MLPEVFYQNIFEPQVEAYFRSKPTFWDHFNLFFSNICLHECRTTYERLLMLGVRQTFATYRLFLVAKAYPQLPPGITTLWILEKFLQSVTPPRYKPNTSKYFSPIHPLNLHVMNAASAIPFRAGSVYHGTTKKSILSSAPRQSIFSDFGRAFYVTDSLDYAIRHATILAELMHDSPVIVECAGGVSFLNHLADSENASAWGQMTKQVRDTPRMPWAAPAVFRGPIVQNAEELAIGYFESVAVASPFTQWAIYDVAVLKSLMEHILFFMFPL